MKQFLTCFLLFVCPSVYAQLATLSGKIIHADTKLPYAEVTILLKDMKMITTSDAAGNYQFGGVPMGTHELQYSADDAIDETVKIEVAKSNVMLDIVELKVLAGSGLGNATDQSGGFCRRC